MEGCNPINTPIESKARLLDYDGEDIVSPTIYKNLIKNLRYFTWIRPCILYGIDMVSRNIEKPTITHMKAMKKYYDTSKVVSTLCYFILTLTSLIL